MSRIAKQPVVVPKGTEVTIQGQHVTVKGSKGTEEFDLHPTVTVEQEDGQLLVKPVSDQDRAMAGTMRSILNSMVIGASQGFEKKLELKGVGYRAQAQGNKLNLSLGFSHPVEYQMPEGISVETPSQTEIVIKGTNKQRVGQVAAEIRAFRPPEPYKGKGVRYAGEEISLKETKKA